MTVFMAFKNPLVGLLSPSLHLRGLRRKRQRAIGVGEGVVCADAAGGIGIRRLEVNQMGLLP